MDEVGNMKISNYENKDHDDTILKGDHSNTSGMRRAFELSMRHDMTDSPSVRLLLCWRGGLGQCREGRRLTHLSAIASFALCDPAQLSFLCRNSFVNPVTADFLNYTSSWKL